MEHRWGTRVLVDVPVRLRCRSRQFVEARLVNISRSGAFIRTGVALTRFAPIEIELNDQILPSFVVRVQSGGIGVEWTGRLPRVVEIDAIIP